MRRVAPVGAGRHTNQLGEASAEGAQRRAADRETNLGDAEVATTQQRHRAFDAPRHQVPVRRLAVGEPEFAAEVPGRHVRAAGERLDVQRLRVLPVDPVADAAQPREVVQVLRFGGSAGHLCILSIRHSPNPAAVGPDGRRAPSRVDAADGAATLEAPWTGSGRGEYSNGGFGRGQPTLASACRDVGDPRLAAQSGMQRARPRHPESVRLLTWRQEVSMPDLVSVLDRLYLLPVARRSLLLLLPMLSGPPGERMDDCDHSYPWRDGSIPSKAWRDAV